MVINSLTPESDLTYGFDKDRIPRVQLNQGQLEKNGLWGVDGFDFGDLIDLVNPLQHIPGISIIYRHITGDKIDPGARLIGAGLFGGLGGATAAMVNIIVSDITGKDIGENIISAFGTKNSEIRISQPQPSEAMKSVTKSPKTPGKSIIPNVEPRSHADPPSIKPSIGSLWEIPSSVVTIAKKTPDSQSQMKFNPIDDSRVLKFEGRMAVLENKPETHAGLK